MPTATDSAETIDADEERVHQPLQQPPVVEHAEHRLARSPKNQSSVKPFHGSAGNSESLKANIAAAASGAARKTKKATT